MVNIACLIMKKDGGLKFEINEDLLELFENEFEMYKYIDQNKLEEALIPFMNEVIRRV